VPGRTLFANGTDEDDFGLEDLVEEYPWALRSKELIAMVWDGFGRVRRRSQPCSSIVRHGFTSSLTNSEDDFLFLLAVVRTTAPQDAHKRFLREIFRSNGSTFHAEFLVSPPTEVRPLFRERF
jgi:hypothetical protein